jgi:hypothetical protein
MKIKNASLAQSVFSSISPSTKRNFFLFNSIVPYSCFFSTTSPNIDRFLHEENRLIHFKNLQIILSEKYFSLIIPNLCLYITTYQGGSGMS